MYRYNPDNNKDAAIKLLDLAIIDDPEQKELFEEAKSNIESHNKQYNQANEDWATLQNVINQNAIIKPSSSAPEDYASYIFMKEELGRDILAKTFDFWNKYKFIGDPRRLSAFKRGRFLSMVKRGVNPFSVIVRLIVSLISFITAIPLIFVQ